MSTLWTGTLSKMKTEHQATVAYTLVDAFEDELNSLDLNPLLGQQLRLSTDGTIRCVFCGKSTRKSFAQGSCYDCFRRLPHNDLCILKPELCHFHQSADPCRDPAWGEKNCFQPHILYVALSSGTKVGITRKKNIPFRWMDQGAVQAIPVAQVEDRFSVGKLEHHLTQFFNDRTQWQRMLKHQIPETDLVSEVERVLEQFPPDMRDTILPDRHLFEFEYPHLRWPQKVKSVNFEKQPLCEGELIAIKGQYLILDTAVFNVRKHGGWNCTLEVL